MVDRYSFRNPSFSSTLLDAIYRSIDQGEEEVVIYSEPMRKKQIYSSDVGGGGANVRPCGVFKSTEEEMANYQRAMMIEKWMEKKSGDQKGVARRKSAADLLTKKPRKDREKYSSSSSSDSSCGGGFFSSSEAESLPVHRPKPVRTGIEKGKLTGGEDHRRRGHGGGEEFERKPPSKHHESGFLKTKSRALKIYGDLKKVKQPISPGGKLAGFLNSLFTGGSNLKKSKIADYSPSLKSSSSTACSSASSFSRSCLSKTPSSGGKPSHGGGPKRSVRFSPVSVIVDEDCQPCGHKSLYDDNDNNNNYNKKQSSNFEPAKNANNNISSIKSVINEELMVHVMEKNRRVEEVARDLLRNYHRKNEFELSFDHLRKSHVKNQALDQDFDLEQEDDDDDGASYASSDLFELDNLSAIGMERYSEELPVYETTNLGTNRAIANGLVL